MYIALLQKSLRFRKLRGLHPLELAHLMHKFHLGMIRNSFEDLLQKTSDVHYH